MKEMSVGNKKQSFVKIIVWLTISITAGGGFSRAACAQPEAARAAIMAIEEKPADAGAKATFSGGSGKSAQARGTTTSQKAAAKQSAKAPAGTSSTPKDNGLIVGDKYTFLNFDVVKKVQPIWTIKAKSAGAIGLVQVEVTVDPNGSVLTARARTGNLLLHPEAERAALATTFSHPMVNNRPARGMGFLVFRFGRPEDDPEN